MHWIIQAYQWIVNLLKATPDGEKSPNLVPSSTLSAQGAEVMNSPVASGTNISQTINSPTVNLSLPVPTGAPGHERYNEWRELIDEIHESIEQMSWAFVPVVVHNAGDERCDYQAGIRRGNRALGNRILIANAIQHFELKKDWDELVRYAHAGHGPHDRWQQHSPTMGGFDTKAREFQEKLLQVARQDMNATRADLQIASQHLKNNQGAITIGDGPSGVTVVHSVSRMIDRISGEERFEELHQRIAPPLRNRELEIVFGGEYKPYFENQPTAVLPGGKVFDRRYRVGVQNTTGAIVSKARVILEDCEPSEHHGIHLGHALQVMGRPGTSEVSISPSDKPSEFFDVVYDETLEGKLRGDAFGLCYAAPVRLFAIPRGTYFLTLRVEGDGIQSRKKFKIFQDSTSLMLTMREVNLP